MCKEAPFSEVNCDEDPLWLQEDLGMKVAARKNALVVEGKGLVFPCIRVFGRSSSREKGYLEEVGGP